MLRVCGSSSAAAALGALGVAVGKDRFDARPLLLHHHHLGLLLLLVLLLLLLLRGEASSPSSRPQDLAEDAHLLRR